MKKFLALSVVFVFLFIPLSAIAPLSVTADGAALPTVSARSAIVMGLGASPDNDSVLFERDADASISPAAMVRLMAGIYAFKAVGEKNIAWDTAGTYPSDLANAIGGTGLATANMLVGDSWTLKDLLTVSMVTSAADAADTMAVTVSGSLSAFIQGMNALAKDLGCAHTAFTNVTGLDAPGQRTTVRDMAVIARYAMGFPELQAMLKTAGYDVTPLKGAAYTAINVNSMVRPGVKEYYMSNMLFGRTGFSDTSGRCMASAAENGGYIYIAVVAGCAGADGADSPTAHFTDTQALYNWAFSEFTYKVLLQANQPVASMKVDLAWSTDTVTLAAKDNVAALVDKNLNVSDSGAVKIVPTLNQAVTDAPITKGAVYGKAALYIKDASGSDQKAGETDLIAVESLPRSRILLIWRGAKGLLTSPWLYLGLILVAGLIAAYVLSAVRQNKRKKNKNINS